MRLSGTRRFTAESAAAVSIAVQTSGVTQVNTEVAASKGEGAGGGVATYRLQQGSDKSRRERSITGHAPLLGTLRNRKLSCLGYGQGDA